jgi:hypothetical protein
MATKSKAEDPLHPNELTPVWLRTYGLPIIAALASATLTLAGTLVVNQVASGNERELQRESLLNDKRLSIYGDFMGKLQQTRRSQDRLFVLATNDSPDISAITIASQKLREDTTAMVDSGYQAQLIGTTNAWFYAKVSQVTFSELSNSLTSTIESSTEASGSLISKEQNDAYLSLTTCLDTQYYQGFIAAIRSDLDLGNVVHYDPSDCGEISLDKPSP